MPSDGGGKAREWTLDYAGIADSDGPIPVGEEVVVIEKEWADRQLAEARELIDRMYDWLDAPDYTSLKHVDAAKQAQADAATYLKRTGGPDDS